MKWQELVPLCVLLLVLSGLMVFQSVQSSRLQDLYRESIYGLSEEKQALEEQRKVLQQQYELKKDEQYNAYGALRNAEKDLDELGALQEELDAAHAQLEQLRTQGLRLSTPLMLRQYDFPGGIGAGQEPATLFLEVLKGIYDEDSGTWNSMWSGDFQFRVQFSDGSSVVSGPYSFSLDGDSGHFEFAMEDYNGDGDPDFALGQWGAMSAGDYYGIFTVRPNGAVELLPIRGERRSASAFGLIRIEEEEQSHSFFWPHSHDQSPLLERLPEPGFAISYTAYQGLEEYVFLEEALEQAAAAAEEGAATTYRGTVRDVYEWQQEEFVLVRQELLDLD